jgi:hypothetical protein
MIVAYLSHDEVNLDLAQRLADAAGILLCPLFVRDMASAVSFDAVLCDLDCLPPAERAGTLKALLVEPLTCPVGVHSYSLVWSKVQALRARGVTVSRRLHEGAFADLVQAASDRRTGYGRQPASGDAGGGGKGGRTSGDAPTTAARARGAASEGDSGLRTVASPGLVLGVSRGHTGALPST